MKRKMNLLKKKGTRRKQRKKRKRKRKIKRKRGKTYFILQYFQTVPILAII